MTEWLKQHWFLFSAILIAGTAWGQQQNKIVNLEDAVKKQVQIAEKLENIKDEASKDREKAIREISEIRQQNARIEERINLLVSMQQQQIRQRTVNAPTSSTNQR